MRAAPALSRHSRGAATGQPAVGEDRGRRSRARAMTRSLAENGALRSARDAETAGRRDDVGKLRRVPPPCRLTTCRGAESSELRAGKRPERSCSPTSRAPRTSSRRWATRWQGVLRWHDEALRRGAPLAVRRAPWGGGHRDGRRLLRRVRLAGPGPRVCRRDPAPARRSSSFGRIRAQGPDRRARLGRDPGRKDFSGKGVHEAARIARSHRATSGRGRRYDRRQIFVIAGTSFA
jgi:hypothetical protein